MKTHHYTVEVEHDVEPDECLTLRIYYRGECKSSISGDVPWAVARLGERLREFAAQIEKGQDPS